MSKQGNGAALAQRQSTEIVTAQGEVPQDFREAPSALEAVTRAEIDIQINTAKHFPRDFSRFVRTAKAMVAADPDLAAACTYILPARKGSTERTIFRWRSVSA